MKRLLRTAWTEFRYWLFIICSFLAGKLPVRFTYLIGATIADGFYLFGKRLAANAVSNMRRVLGEEADWQTVKRVARDSFRNYGRLAVDFIRVPHMSDLTILKTAGIPAGLHNIDGALAKGKGVVVVTGHFGNWDVGGAAIGRLDYKLNAVADTFEPEKLDKLINGTREKCGISIIPMESAQALKELFMALRRNELVFLLFDNPQQEGGVEVEFFGENVAVPGGPAALTLKTGAALMIGYGYRNPDGVTFTCVAEPEIEYKHLITGNKEHDIQAITQEIVRRMESVIRQHPGQWYMFREMWPRTERHNLEVRRRRLWGGQRARDIGIA